MNTGAHANVSNGLVNITSGAKSGEVITVTATVGEKSNTYTITVVPTQFSLSSNKTNALANDDVQLTINCNPTLDASVSVEYVIVSGGTFIEDGIGSDGSFTITNTATSGSIVVKVQYGPEGSKIVSNEVEIFVNSYTINVEGYDDIYILADSKAAAHALSVTVYDGSYNAIANPQLSFELTTGSDKVVITDASGSTVSTVKKNIQAVKYGDSVLRITFTVQGKSIYKDISIKSAVPPEAMSLPELISSRGSVDASYQYVVANKYYDINTHTAVANYKLPFAPIISGTNCCTTYNAIFTSVGEGSTADGTYNADNSITFSGIGKVRVTFTSNSGSSQEESVSYIFNVVDGFVVTTFEQLKDAIEARDSSLKTSKMVIIVDSKVAGTNSYANYDFGYNIVPQYLQANYGRIWDYTQAGATPVTLADIAALKAMTLTSVDDLSIEGNYHSIDVSSYPMTINQLQPIKDSNDDQTFLGSTEFLSANGGFNDTNDDAVSAKFSNRHGAFFHFEASSNETSYTISISNLSIIGESGYNADARLMHTQILQADGTVYMSAKHTAAFYGYTKGIRINASEFKGQCNIQFSNVSISKWYQGVFAELLSSGSKMTNSQVKDIYGNGIEIERSLLELNNMFYDRIGCFPITLGINAASDVQTIDMTGSVELGPNMMIGGYLNGQQVLPPYFTTDSSGKTQLLAIQGQLLSTLDGTTFSADATANAAIKNTILSSLFKNYNGTTHDGMSFFIQAMPDTDKGAMVNPTTITLDGGLPLDDGSHMSGATPSDYVGMVGFSLQTGTDGYKTIKYIKITLPLGTGVYASIVIYNQLYDANA